MSVDSDTIEHMFELHAGAQAVKPVSPRAVTLGQLRDNIRHLEHRSIGAGVIPVSPVIDTLLPEGGLVPGATYSVSPHVSAMWALIAHATSNGHYVATIGRPHLGFRAAVEYGVSLDRLIVIPRAGQHWWSTVVSLIDVVSIIVAHPEGPLPSPAVRDTVMARARERGCALLVTADWPQPHGRISVDNTRWDGLGHGWGVLASHTFTLSYHPRRGVASRQVTLVRDASGVRAVSDDPVSPLAHLTPREKNNTPTASRHREAG